MRAYLWVSLLEIGGLCRGLCSLAVVADITCAKDYKQWAHSFGIA